LGTLTMLDLLTAAAASGFYGCITLARL